MDTVGLGLSYTYATQVQAEPSRSCAVTFKLDPPTLESWLTWAGKKFIAMPQSSAKPSGMKSFWPEYERDFEDTEGLKRQLALKRAAPAAHEVFIVEQILSIPALCTKVEHRRVLHLRTIIDPVSGKHVYNFSRIARKLHTTRQTARNWYELGLQDASNKTDRKKVSLIAAFFAESL